MLGSFYARVLEIGEKSPASDASQLQRVESRLDLARQQCRDLLSSRHSLYAEIEMHQSHTLPALRANISRLLRDRARQWLLRDASAARDAQRHGSASAAGPDHSAPTVAQSQHTGARPPTDGGTDARRPGSRGNADNSNQSDRWAELCDLAAASSTVGIISKWHSSRRLAATLAKQQTRHDSHVATLRSALGAQQSALEALRLGAGSGASASDPVQQDPRKLDERLNAAEIAASQHKRRALNLEGVTQEIRSGAEHLARLITTLARRDIAIGADLVDLVRNIEDEIVSIRESNSLGKHLGGQ